ncbi:MULTISPECIES: amidophosphoribosyltransferase [Clostridium]|uniref:Amidophosphoribosyltransferase n=1 Tax=Clostridium cibarium TaxID=2762247 RepID=A0ABR8PUP0_9CLOT|nr:MULTISPECIES: amidophosphoribosyltransferase [Clostridium]MBD7911881.1 amidophosphoribosyltransferase [Clostridium cibarium]
MDLEIDNKFKEECGVFGGIDFDNKLNCSKLTYFGLYALQHRGQESCGIAVYLKDRIKCHKDVGTVNQVFNEEILDGLKGSLAIGHVRYATNGQNSNINAQPFIISNGKEKIAIAHNGHLLNAKDLKSKLAKYKLNSTVDSEILGYMILNELEKNVSIENSIISLMDDIKGAYSLVIIVKDKLIGVRDPLGMRPLCIGKLNNSYFIASESCALDAIGAEFVRDIEPGEVVTIDKYGIKSEKKQIEEQKKLCIFEFMYFAREDSKIDGISVYKARENIGKELAKSFKIDADLVVGVPDSGIPASIAYAKESGIPYGQGFVKNKYVGRTFIKSTQSERVMAVKIKLNPIQENINGKRIILIDDSLVRGTTLKGIVKLLKASGAKEVHVVIAAPPIKFSCFYGVATSNRKELIASSKSIEEIRKYISADSLDFMSVESLLRAVGKQNNSYGFCTACFNGEYPYVEDEEVQLTKKAINF